MSDAFTVQYLRKFLYKQNCTSLPSTQLSDKFSFSFYIAQWWNTVEFIACNDRNNFYLVPALKDVFPNQPTNRPLCFFFSLNASLTIVVLVLEIHLTALTNNNNNNNVLCRRMWMTHLGTNCCCCSNIDFKRSLITENGRRDTSLYGLMDLCCYWTAPMFLK